MTHCKAADGRPLRVGARVLTARAGQACYVVGFISPSVVAVKCPREPSGKQVWEVPCERVWHDDKDGRVEWLAHRLER